MSRIIRGLMYWSLQITGLSIIWFNYQQYTRQEEIKAAYGCAKNVYRTLSHALAIRQHIDQYKKKQSTLAEFNSRLAETIRSLCQANGGVYARLGQYLGSMVGVLPSQYSQQWSQLDSLKTQQRPYSDMRRSLSQSIGKDLKQVFDGLATTPISVSLFWQTYKAVLLQNYRQVTVKVMQPSTLFQAEYDFWFMEKCLHYASEYVQREKVVTSRGLQFLKGVLEQARKRVQAQLDFQSQLDNVQKYREMAFQSGSALYLPYYYSKLCNKHVIIRQLVEGTPLNDQTSLTQKLKINKQYSLALVLSQLHALKKKYGVLPTDVNENNVLIRKYVKPVRWSKNTNQQSALPQPAVLRTQSKKKTLQLHPSHQVVLLSLGSFQTVPSVTVDAINKYWAKLKQEKIRPSLNSFRERVQNIRQGSSEDNFREKSYIYEPVIRMYERVLGGQTK